MRNPTSPGYNHIALVAVAGELGVMFIGAILPTPLYPLYREAFGFSAVTLTLIYATYVLGNLAALLFFGRLADQIGRRAASLPAIAIGIASASVFAAAENTAWLFAARGLSGFSTGLASGAATAWIAELYASRASGGAARIASAANFFGCATGPLLGGLFAQFAFAPLRLCYFAYLVLLCGAAGVIFMPRETVSDQKPLGDVSLRPRIGVPQRIRLQFVSPAVTGFATFSLIGFYSALIQCLDCRSRGTRSLTGTPHFRRGAGWTCRRAWLSRQPRSDQPHRAGRPAQRSRFELHGCAVWPHFAAGARNR